MKIERWPSGQYLFCVYARISSALDFHFQYEYDE